MMKRLLNILLKTRKLFAVFLILTLIAFPSLAQEFSTKKVTVFLTAQATSDRLTNKGTIGFQYYPQPEEDEATIFVDDDKTFQTFLGMGGAFTDATAINFFKLPDSIQKEMLSAYFDSVNGIGYNLSRIPINSCDFSLRSHSYVNENDSTLKSFSIKPDMEFRIPFIKRALAVAATDYTIFASPWSAPAWMKTNNSMLQGGKIIPKYYQAWANYYVRFVNEYEKQGIPIWGLSVQNEPMSPQTWESCTYSAEEERDFVKYYLGPNLHRNNLGRLKLIIWDHNRGLLYQRAKVVYDDPQASKYVWGAGFHWYSGENFDNVRITHDAYPDKNLLFTEGCFYPFNYSRINEWIWGESYATSIMNDLNNWAVGWTDWNMLLDENGGPNHKKLFCYAPLIYDFSKGKLNYMNSYYYIGHFSKFIRPGAKRIVCSSATDKLMATAFINPDGKIAVVVMNKTEKAVDCKLWYGSNIAKFGIPAHAIITMIVE